MSSGFFRGIWITLRAANYTSQAMNDASKGLNKVQQAQVRLAKSSVQLGLMYVAMGSMALQGMVGVMQFSERGQQLMADFSESVEPALIRLADAFATILEQALPVVSAFLNLITAYPPITLVVAGLALLAATGLIVMGVVTALKGAVVLLGGTFSFLAPKVAISKVTLDAWIPTTQAATGATMGLGMALGIVTAGFTIFITLGAVIGNVRGTIVAGLVAITLAVLALATAFNILSLGTLTVAQLGAAAAGVGMAAGIMAIQSGQEYQMGTTFVGKTGLAMVHRGEAIFNPATGTPRELANDMNRGETRSRSDINVTIEKLYTKSDVDELDDRFARIGRNNMRSNR